MGFWCVRCRIKRKDSMEIFCLCLDRFLGILWVILIFFWLLNIQFSYCQQCRHRLIRFNVAQGNKNVEGFQYFYYFAFVFFLWDLFWLRADGVDRVLAWLGLAVSFSMISCLYNESREKKAKYDLNFVCKVQQVENEKLQSNSSENL